MARERPTASDVPQIPTDLDASRFARGGADGGAGLSHAQVRAQRRCTPLTKTEFYAHRQARIEQYDLLAGRSVGGDPGGPAPRG